MSNLPFPVQQIGQRRYRVMLDDFWQTCFDWAREAGCMKEQGKYQGTPPI